ncbi:MAG: hypothetical protein GY792_06350, partial [Gammaproteobacteria bacterium]|nr:hypothetical protein [Gammaproteobacteria bacterium]
STSGINPALVYGPTAESIRGFNGPVKLESVHRVTQSIALFIADWCGLDKYSRIEIMVNA